MCPPSSRKSAKIKYSRGQVGVRGDSQPHNLIPEAGKLAHGLPFTYIDNVRGYCTLRSNCFREVLKLRIVFQDGLAEIMACLDDLRLDET